jgi:hypothetical protein
MDPRFQKIIDHIVEQDIRLRERDAEIRRLTEERDDLRAEMERLVQQYESHTWEVA